MKIEKIEQVLTAYKDIIETDKDDLFFKPGIMADIIESQIDLPIEKIEQVLTLITGV